MQTPKIHRTCPECGVRFEMKHHRQQFCTPAHKTLYGNRQLSRGQALVSLAQAWRLGRNLGKGADPAMKEAAKMAFADMCRLADEYNAEDKHAGRLPALKVYRRRAAAGLFDR